MGLARNSLLLGGAQMVETALQLLLPIILVRVVDAEAFGDYRLLWLSLSTIATIAPFEMPMALYYFLPRATQAEKHRYVINTALFLLCGGLLGALVLTAFQMGVGGNLIRLERFGLWVPLFIVFWTAAGLIDILPAIEERFTWQAKASIGLSILRAAAAAGTAWYTGRIELVVIALCLLAVFKSGLLGAYIYRYHGRGTNAKPELAPFAKQMQYALPFGAASILFGLRSQTDQWIAASLFGPAMFGAFSIAFVLGPLVTLVRRAVTGVQMSAMNRQHADGDLAGALKLNNAANLLVATVVFPVLAFVLFFAEEGIALIYTGTYVAAGGVLRVLMLIWMLQVVELNSILMLTRDGKASALINLVLLGFSIAISLTGAHYFGLPGAAMGGSVSALLERWLLLYRISHTTALPISALQEWVKLGRILLVALGCALVAYLCVDTLAPAGGAWLRLSAAAAISFSGYVAFVHLFGYWPIKAAPSTSSRG